MYITGFYAGLLTLFYFYLTLQVVKQRRNNSIGIGDGGNTTVQRAIRVHGNFSEYIPIAIVLLFIIEAQNSPKLLCHSLGIVLILGRIFHHIGLSSSSGKSFGRFFGTFVTLICLLVSGFYLIGKFLLNL